MKATPDRRAHVEYLLREFPQLSDRAIARDVGGGISNKTVSRWRHQLGIEQGYAVESLTTAELLAGVEASGVKLSGRQLVRWTQIGLIPSGARARDFRVGGSRTIWWPGLLDLIPEAARLRTNYRRDSDAVLGLLAFGWEMEEAAVKAAYRSFLGRLHGSLVPAAAGSDGAADETPRRLRRRRYAFWYAQLKTSSDAHGGVSGINARARLERDAGLSPRRRSATSISTRWRRSHGSSTGGSPAGTALTISTTPSSRCRHGRSLKSYTRA